jgi:hypothetical protein
MDQANRMKLNTRASVAILAGGDFLVIALVTVIGFASHGELSSAGARMLTTFVPLLGAWGMTAPFLGAYDLDHAADLRQTWRPFWAMVLAGPLASWLRGLMLNAPIMPVFVLVITGVSALGMLGWRVIYALLARRGR